MQGGLAWSCWAARLLTPSLSQSLWSCLCPRRVCIFIRWSRSQPFRLAPSINFQLKRGSCRCGQIANGIFEKQNMKCLYFVQFHTVTEMALLSHPTRRLPLLTLPQAPCPCCLSPAVVLEGGTAAVLGVFSQHQVKCHWCRCGCHSAVLDRLRLLPSYQSGPFGG